MWRRALLLLVLPLLTASAPLPALSFPGIDHIVVEKAARRMTLYGVGGTAHVITGVQLGGQPVGPKRFQGDRRTPEGRFVIDYGNDRSAFHLSLHISYPRAEDVALARASGRSPGGDVFIHGQPDAWPAGRVPGDWTDGCIAVSDEEIEALWEAVGDGTPIEIRP